MNFIEFILRKQKYFGFSGFRVSILPIVEFSGYHAHANIFELKSIRIHLYKSSFSDCVSEICSHQVQFKSIPKADAASLTNLPSSPLLPSQTGLKFFPYIIPKCMQGKALLQKSVFLVSFCNPAPQQLHYLVSLYITASMTNPNNISLQDDKTSIRTTTPFEDLEYIGQYFGLCTKNPIIIYIFFFIF